MSVRSSRLWSLLRSYVREGTIGSDDLTRLRDDHLQVFKTFPRGEDDNVDSVVEYSFAGLEFILVQRNPGKVLMSDLRKSSESGVDNTGNVGTWPSSQVLAYYLHNNRHFTMGRDVIELGAGSGMLGIFTGMFLDCRQVVITDGSEMAVEHIKKSVSANAFPPGPAVSSRLLRWDHLSRSCADLVEAFDVALVSDCLFFEKFHESLLRTLEFALREAALVLMVAPSRGGSRERFLEKASGMFSCDLLEDFDPHISALDKKNAENPSYDASRHKPALIVMRKRTGGAKKMKHEMTSTLAAYASRHSLRDTDILADLRAETAKLPNARMQISPDQGEFMGLIVRMLNVKRALEIGVYTGYSSLVTAQALGQGATLDALDVSEEWTSLARRYWKRAGVADKISLHIAPALETLEQFALQGLNSSFDFAFIDADKENYYAYYEAVLALLRPGGCMMIDNVFWHGKVCDRLALQDIDDGTAAIKYLNYFVHRDPRVRVSIVPFADGISMILKL